MGKIDKEMAIEMRRDGKTFREIGQHFGVSYQYVEMELRGSDRARKDGPVFENIPYKGLYEFVQTNKTISIPRLRKLMGMESGRKENEKVRRFLLGYDVFLQKHAYDNLIKATGMTYEQLFELRDGFEIGW